MVGREDGRPRRAPGTGTARPPSTGRRGNPSARSPRRGLYGPVTPGGPSVRGSLRGPQRTRARRRRAGPPARGRRRPRSPRVEDAPPRGVGEPPTDRRAAPVRDRDGGRARGHAGPRPRRPSPRRRSRSRPRSPRSSESAREASPSALLLVEQARFLERKGDAVGARAIWERLAAEPSHPTTVRGRRARARGDARATRGRPRCGAGPSRGRARRRVAARPGRRPRAPRRPAAAGGARGGRRHRDRRPPRARPWAGRAVRSDGRPDASDALASVLEETGLEETGPNVSTGVDALRREAEAVLAAVPARRALALRLADVPRAHAMGLVGARLPDGRFLARPLAAFAAELSATVGHPLALQASPPVRGPTDGLRGGAGGTSAAARRACGPGAPSARGRDRRPPPPAARRPLGGLAAGPVGRRPLAQPVAPGGGPRALRAGGRAGGRRDPAQREGRPHAGRLRRGHEPRDEDAHRGRAGDGGDARRRGACPIPRARASTPSASTPRWSGWAPPCATCSTPRGSNAATERGRATRGPLEPVDVVSAFAEGVRPVLEGRGFRFDVDARAAGRPLAVDPDALEHVLGNLVDNAAKFAESRREIEVRAGPHGDGFRIEVRDRGPGRARRRAGARVPALRAGRAGRGSARCRAWGSASTWRGRW